MGKWEDVCAALVTPEGRLLVVKRSAQSADDYHELPHWPVAPSESSEATLVNALRERLAANFDLHSLLHVTTIPPFGTTCYLYLARVSNWSTATLSTDPSFSQLLQIPLTAWGDIADLEPTPIASFLHEHVKAGADLFALPDLRITSADANRP